MSHPPERDQTALILKNADGSTEGADPRALSREAFGPAGHAKTPLLKVIRAKCLDCCVGNAAEVNRCTAIKCPLWPYRMNHNPFHDHPGGFKKK